MTSRNQPSLQGVPIYHQRFGFVPLQKFADVANTLVKLRDEGKLNEIDPKVVISPGGSPIRDVAGLDWEDKSKKVYQGSTLYFMGEGVFGHYRVGKGSEAFLGGGIVGALLGGGISSLMNYSADIQAASACMGALVGGNLAEHLCGSKTRAGSMHLDFESVQDLPLAYEIIARTSEPEMITQLVKAHPTLSDYL